MKMIYQRVLLSILFLTPLHAYSQAADSPKSKTEYKKLFKQAYGAYKQSLDQGDAGITYQYAKESYQFGCKAYGEHNINCANLGLNYLSHMKSNDTDSPKVGEIVMPVLKKKYGAKSIDVIDFMILSASKYPSNNKEQAIDIISTALEYLNDAEVEPVLKANIELSAGKALLKFNSNKAVILKNSYNDLSAKLHPDDGRLLEHRFWAAKYWMTTPKKSLAIELFEKNIQLYESIENYTHPYELVSRAHLVALYEHKKQSDEATRHCIAIGEIRPWDDNQEQIPLFRIAPTYPINAARNHKEGWVQLSFNIDENGMVREPKVLKSSSKIFRKSSLNALKQWRYAPKFENGKAVEATGLTVQLDYKMGKSYTNPHN
ncbi:energy transducer TonB [Thalassomonas sp. M1454]|uniref:energy transducer TonB n=1 Tax=Thalassomonas sp. M1454 TaxID=2594477 RepID=UPI00117DC596|nr:energy transducer TonB [Thalassomonas sp. M1454]TRX54970.1 energy transducer TonB [Thalassomonas sp. M1454]